MPTVAVDFDGVIHGYQSGWKGAGECPDPPVPGAAKFLNDLVMEGYSVVVHSTRCETLEGRVAVAKYLNEIGVSPGVIVTHEKPKAILYVDDRGFCFCGEFPTMEFIRSFKPWNKS